MPLVDIKAQIAADVAAVPGVGVVYQHQPIVFTEQDFKTKMLDPNGKLNAVTITRAAMPSLYESISGRKDRHQIVVRYWMAIQDTNDESTTSEFIFEGLIEAVRAALNADRHLTDAAGKRHGFQGGPVQIKTQTYAMLTGVLCHYAELGLEVEEYPAIP